MQQRKIHMDLLRIVAILCVIYNHTRERGYYLYAFPSSSVLHYFYIAMAAFIAVAVPIFFMLSGALLLPKEESLGDLFRKRVCRIVLVIVLFSVLQYVIMLLEHRAEPTVSYFLRALFEEGMITPYWFLYAYLAYLLILPFLRKLVRVMKKQDYLYLFGLLLVVEGAIPAILYPFGVTELNPFFELPLLNHVSVYPLLGYYIENYMEEEQYNKRTTAVVLLSMLLVLVFFVGMTSLRALPYESFNVYDTGLYTGSLTMILDAGVYYLVKRFCMKQKGHPRMDKIVHSIGQCVFGIYLMEQPIREHLTFVCDRLVPVIGRFPACIVWVLCVFVIAYLMVLLMRQIPGLKKLL